MTYLEKKMGKASEKQLKYAGPASMSTTAKEVV